MAACAVLVRVDPDIETAECDICSVTGVELSAAPRRPATHKTIVRKFEWVPYGETIDSDLDRQMYYRLLKGYNRDRIDAAIDAAYPNPEDLPPHLVKVRGTFPCAWMTASSLAMPFPSLFRCSCMTLSGYWEYAEAIQQKA